MSDTTVVDYLALKKENAALNLEEIRLGSAELHSMPRYVMVELTQGCNLKCSMCRSRSIRYAEKEMDREIFRRTADLLFPAAEMVDVRGWGESLLAPDFEEILESVIRYQARCRIVTNLSLNRPRLFDLLVENNAMIDISLDAVRQEVVDQARSGANMKVIDKNLRRLVAGMIERHGSAEALRLVATVQRVTLDSLVELVEYAAEVGVPQIVLNEVTLGPGDPKALVGMEDEVDLWVGRASRRAGELGVRLYAGTTFGRSVGLKKEVPFCIHPWSYAAVGYDGSVGYCDHLIGPMMKFSCMGDITKDEFHRIWNGDPWRSLREWHASGHKTEDPRYSACFQCYKHRNVDFEDVFEPRLERLRLDLTPVRASS
ncbi:radical SAM/SPASM domain-containing protein [Crossiella sp. CA-258035]|uniref:radical SAM/SPASM domain-containing protein n=1 Tax=Crossiella sp. CA-258035 TaxID=2981138 RepID=UPI0024BC7195|nr:radical SAM/SPASM domain-containing protein [Crossiella sp. CA-258035]WHT16226.1 radical SAM/SPASM domain-containing protein [Crossiella sp. CA-258035]